MVPSERILVVGGGIAGLTFAVAATRLGIDVSVVERSLSVETGAAGIGLHLNAQRALRRIGLETEVAAHAVELDGYHFVDADEQEIAYHPYAEVWGAPTWSVHRADLNAVLRAALRDDQVTLGLSVRTVHADGDRVDVTFSNGTSGEYDLVVGADGVHSAVRAQVVGTGLVRYGDACFWRTTLPERIVDQATGTRRGDCSVGLIPLTRDRTHAFFQMRVEQPPADEPERAEILRQQYSHMSKTIDRALTLLAGDRDIHFGILEWVEPPTWGVARVVLVGDAAHSQAPPLALGGAMAIEDAVVLADELAHAGEVDSAIARFVARREPRCSFVQERTRIIWDLTRGVRVPGEPRDMLELFRRNYVPLLAEP